MKSTIDYFNERWIGEPNSGCWIWTAGCVGNGYASMVDQETKKQIVAHRFSYGYFKGTIPDGLELDHTCRVRCCVNPDHLEPVTRKENLHRSPIWLGNRTECPHGHAYNAENTYFRKLDSSPRCRVCDRKRHARYRKLRVRGG